MKYPLGYKYAQVSSSRIKMHMLARFSEATFDVIPVFPMIRQSP